MTPTFFILEKEYGMSMREAVLGPINDNDMRLISYIRYHNLYLPQADQEYHLNDDISLYHSFGGIEEVLDYIFNNKVKN